MRIHRMIRRGTAYGPPLPDGQLKDDGVDRGLMFAFVGANLARQFEFVQSEWINDSAFFAGDSTERDPITGAGDGTAPTAYRIGRCGGSCAGCRASSSRAVENTAFFPALAR